MTDQPEDPRADDAQAAPAAPDDPWRSFGAVMAATLILEAVVVLLALPVVGAVGGGLTAVSLTYLLGLAALLILLSGLQRRPWAIWVNLGVQLVPLAGFAIYPGVGFIGLLFAGVWALIAYLRAEVRRRQESRRKSG
jgi:Protein of unknown function (DUF4233)